MDWACTHSRANTCRGLRGMMAHWCTVHPSHANLRCLCAYISFAIVDLAEAQVRVEALELRETQLLGALAAQPPSVEHPELNTIPTSDVKIASLQRKLDVAAELETSLRGKLKAMEIQSMHTHAAPPPRVQYTEFSPATRIPIGDGGPLVPSPPRKSPGGRGQRLRQHQLFRRASSLGIEQRVGRVSAPDPEVLVGSLPAYPEAMPPIRASATDG